MFDSKEVSCELSPGAVLTMRRAGVIGCRLIGCFDEHCRLSGTAIAAASTITGAAMDGELIGSLKLFMTPSHNPRTRNEVQRGSIYRTILHSEILIALLASSHMLRL